MILNSIFPLSDCWHESESEENLSVQNVCVEMSQARTPKKGLLNGKTHPCDICVPVLTGSLHLDDLPEQKLFLVEACSILQGQKHPSAKNPLKGDVDSDSPGEKLHTPRIRESLHLSEN